MQGKIMKTEIAVAFEFLAVNAGKLSPGQLELIKGIQKYYRQHKALSERQQKTLFEIKKYMNASFGPLVC